MNKKQKLKEIKWLKDLKMILKKGLNRIKEQIQKRAKEIKRIKTPEELEREKKIKEEEKRKRRIIIIIILLLLLLLFIKIIFIGNGIKISKGNNEVFKVKNENTIFEKINKNSKIKISTENIIGENEIVKSDDIEVNNKNNEIKNDKNSLNKNTYKINDNENYVNNKEGNNTTKNNLNENKNIKTDENTNEKNEEIENNKNNNQENIVDKEKEETDEKTENDVGNNIEDNKENDNTNNTENNKNNNKDETNNTNEQDKEDTENNKPNNEGNKEPTQQEETKVKYYISGKVKTENTNNEHIATIVLYKANNTNSSDSLGSEIKRVKTNKDGTFQILIYEAKESEIIDLNKNNIPDEIEYIYNIKITKQSYLNYTIKGIKFNNNSEILQIGIYELIAGDIDKSGVIDILDLSRVTGSCEKTITEENKEEIQKCDLNEDGKVDELDIKIANKNFRKVAKIAEWKGIE